jgi:hypothetical protein
MRGSDDDSEVTQGMNATSLDTEATRYLEAIDLCRSMGLDIKWRSEAYEVEVFSPVPALRRPSRCKHCAGPLVRINGRYLCLRIRNNENERARCHT